MADKKLVTRVYNTTANDLPVGFLSDNGATISANSYFDHPGILENDLSPEERDTLDAMLAAGTLQLLVINSGNTDGVWSPTITLQKSFGRATGSAEVHVYNASCPAKIKIIKGHIIFSRSADKHAKYTVDNGTNTILGPHTVTASTGMTYTFTGTTVANQTIETGSTIDLTISGNTGKANGSLYLTAIRVS